MQKITTTDLRKFLYDKRGRDLLVYSHRLGIYAAMYAARFPEFLSIKAHNGNYRVIISRSALRAMLDTNGGNLDLIAAFLNCED